MRLGRPQGLARAPCSRVGVGRDENAVVAELHEAVLADDLDGLAGEPRAGLVAGGREAGRGSSVDEFDRPRDRFAHLSYEQAVTLLGHAWETWHVLVVRGTKKLRDRVKGLVAAGDVDVSTGALGDWFATALFWKRMSRCW